MTASPRASSCAVPVKTIRKPVAVKRSATEAKLAAVERGYPQSEIQQQAYDWQRSIETGERTIVSVNKFNKDDIIRQAKASR